jgi:ribosomal protein L27
VYVSGEVTLRRIHFKNGQATAYAGAIYNNGEVLALESCVFSGNRIESVYTTGDYAALTVRGCTFYDNNSPGFGGAIRVNSGTLTLTGNLFYGNTTAVRGPVVYRQAGTVTSGGYNVCDVAIGTGSDQSGFTAATGDATFAELGITGAPFDATFAPAPELGIIPSAPQDFPAVDFYGAPRTFPGAPGAVQQ